MEQLILRTKNLKILIITYFAVFLKISNTFVTENKN